MNNTITTASDTGAFDAIRHIDENGNEYWLGRELMSLFGYKEWRNFAKVIRQVETLIENIGDSKADHVYFFHGSTKNINAKGRPSENYKLTRLACYLIAANCDSTKPEVALSQRYFATKAREAELAAVESKPKQRTIWDLDGCELALIATYQQYRKKEGTDRYCKILVESIEPEFWRMSEEVAVFLMDRYEANQELKKLEMYKQVMAYEQIEVKKVPELLLVEAQMFLGFTEEKVSDVFEAAKILAQPIYLEKKKKIEQKYPANSLLEGKAKAFQASLEQKQLA